MCPRPTKRVKDSHHASWVAGARGSLAQGPDPTLRRSKRDGARSSRRRGLAGGPGLRVRAPGTKCSPTCAGGAGASPRMAPARAHEVTSGARRPEEGLAWGGGEKGVDFAARPRPSSHGSSAGAGPAGPGPPHTSARRCRLIHIYEANEGRGQGPPQRPAPGLRISPRRRLRPQWGAPDFRLGEGVSTWSGLKNVSLPLLRPLVPALRGEGLLQLKARGAAPRS